MGYVYLDIHAEICVCGNRCMNNPFKGSRPDVFFSPLHLCLVCGVDHRCHSGLRHGPPRVTRDLRQVREDTHKKTSDGRRLTHSNIDTLE